MCCMLYVQYTDNWTNLILFYVNETQLMIDNVTVAQSNLNTVLEPTQIS